MTTSSTGPSVVRDFAAVAMAPKAGTSLPKICLVTGELVGPFQNGGLGTSMTGLIEFLAAHGADCTIIYTGTVKGDLAEWKAKYANAGIKLEALVEFGPPAILGPLVRIGWVNSWTLYGYLKTHAFDVIHFNDTMGEAAYCMLAKRHGLAFANTLLTVALHSPTEWILEHNGQIANWAGFCCFTSGERLSIQNSDLLWGPSRYLLGWINERGYGVPQQVYNQQYVVPSGHLFDAGSAKVDKLREAAPKRSTMIPKEIVFFGRLEERKGIRLFTSAITKMGSELAERGVTVTFMGKPSTVNGVDASEFLAARAPNWPFNWRQESGFGQVEAVAYLKEPGRFAVMASPVDNSPCTVYEALQFGFPFIAAATGGIPELIHPEDHEKHLFEYKVEALCQRLRDVLSNGISPARPALTISENQDRWFGLHAQWQRFLPAPVGKATRRTFSVLVDHDLGAEDLDSTLAAVRNALGTDIGSLVVLRRELAGISMALQNDPAVMIHDDLSDVSAQEIVEGFKGDAVLAIRSGVRVMSTSKGTFEAFLDGAADAAVPMCWVDEHERPFIHLSASAALAYLEAGHDAGGFVTTPQKMKACLGDRLERLDRTRLYLGILDEVYGANGRVWPIPEVLFSVRTSGDLIRAERAPVRAAHAMGSARHSEIYQMIGIGRNFYNVFFPLAAPVPPAAASAVTGRVKDALTRLPFLTNPQSRQKLEELVARVFGVRGTRALIRAKLWVRSRQ